MPTVMMSAGKTIGRNHSSAGAISAIAPDMMATHNPVRCMDMSNIETS